MKPTVKYAVMGGASMVLLFGSFVAFAALSGVPMHKIAIIKNFVKPPAETPGATPKEGENTAHADPAPKPEAEKPANAKEQTAVASAAGMLGVFSLPSPYSADELTDLQRELRNASKGAKERLAKVEQRERELDDRERELDQREKEQAEMRKQLEGKELEVHLLKDEADRDASAREARESASWKEISKFFEEGEPAELAKKLLSFEPREAVKILRALDDERASAVVNALPADKYHEYLEAYRAQAQKSGAKKQP